MSVAPRTPKLVQPAPTEPVRTFMATYMGQTAPRLSLHGVTYYIRLRFIDDETGQKVNVTCVLHSATAYFVLNTIQTIRKAAGLPKWEAPPDTEYKTLQHPLAGCKGAHVRLDQYAHTLALSAHGEKPTQKYSYRVAS